MIAIFLMELKNYFSSLIGYLIIGCFLLLSGLFLFVFDGSFNILVYGFADLSLFFLIVPWLFLFLIPALTMRSICRERELGTIELLLTRPLTATQLIVGKFSAALVLIIFTLILTIVYVITLSQLGEPVNNLDYGSTTGSYIGAVLLAACYIAIGLWCSAITKNQLIAFILAAALCFFLYFGFEGLNGYLSENDTLSMLGFKYHYESIARGVIDARDIIYFLSIIILFLVLSVVSVNQISKR